MRIQCDVCERAAASVMCCADEAVLCTDCDTRVHAANKLAFKHQRVPLLKAVESPRCDICQEKSAFFFCLEDRALLCRDCDVSIHSATALTSVHQRFLVPGTRVALEALSNNQESADSTQADDLPRLSNPSSVNNSSSMLKSPSAMSSPSANSKSSFNSHMYRPPPVASTPSFAPPPVHLKATPVPQKMMGMNSPVSTLPPRMMPHSKLPTGHPKLMGVGMNVADPHAGHGAHGGVHVHGHGNGGHGHGHVAQQGGNPTPMGQTRRTSITEFLSEAIPSWRVDELLNIPELADGYNLGDIASSKAEVSQLNDYDWTADLSLFDEQLLYAESFHEVPQMLSQPSAPGTLNRAVRVSGQVKGKAKQESFVPDYDDAFVVPDLGLSPGPASPPLPKRRRQFVEV